MRDLRLSHPDVGDLVLVDYNTCGVYLGSRLNNFRQRWVTYHCVSLLDEPDKILELDDVERIRIISSVSDGAQ